MITYFQLTKIWTIRYSTNSIITFFITYSKTLFTNLHTLQTFQTINHKFTNMLKTFISNFNSFQFLEFTQIHFHLRKITATLVKRIIANFQFLNSSRLSEIQSSTNCQFLIPILFVFFILFFDIAKVTTKITIAHAIKEIPATNTTIFQSIAPVSTSPEVPAV